MEKALCRLKGKKDRTLDSMSKGTINRQERFCGTAYLVRSTGKLISNFTTC